MIRVMVCLMMVASLVPGAYAQGVETGDINVAVYVQENPQAVSKVWAEVSSVSPAEAAQLLDRINDALAGVPESSSMEALISLNKDLTQQMAAFKAAYRASMGSGAGKSDDVDTLFGQVFEDKATSDPAYLKLVASHYETLYVQFGQFMNARFLAANRAGIASYRSEDATRASDATKVAQMAEQQVATYQANLRRSAADLRLLLKIEPAKH